MANHCLLSLPVTLVSETEFKFHIEVDTLALSLEAVMLCAGAAVLSPAQ